MLHTRLCDLLRIEHPIVSAPMAGSATAALAVAVSEAGGLGLIGGTTPGGAEWLRREIREARARTKRPFGVGFISSFPGLEELVRAALEEGVSAVSHSFADPTPYIPMAHAAGAKVLVQVQTVAQAEQAVKAGADVIAAQGTEAGGHTGHIGTLASVPAVIDAVGDIPVIAAGGIADGRTLAAVLMLGAEGAWIGTRFVASLEWAGGEWAKARVVAAGADDTVLTRAYDLATAAPFPPDVGDRVIRNDFTARWHGRDHEVEAARADLGQQVMAALRSGDPAIAPVRAGSAVGLIRGIEPAGEIVRRLVAEAEEVLRSRTRAVLGT